MTPGNDRSALLRRLLLALLLAFPTLGSAAIVITPPLPTSNDPVSIQVVNQYTSEARVTSATINRSGNQFFIAITVTVSCFLPTAPILRSTFDVGSLLPGTYDVVVRIDDIAGIPGCPESSREQVAQFQVIEPVVIPANTSLGVAATILLLLGAATAHLRARMAIGATPGSE